METELCKTWLVAALPLVLIQPARGPKFSSNGMLPLPQQSRPGPYAGSCNQDNVLPSESCVPVWDR